MKKTSSFYVLVCCALLILSCKKKEGMVDIPQNAPRLLSASIQPTSIHIDSNRINVDSLGNDTYRIRVSITAEAIDADGAGDIGTASFVITSPRSTIPLSTGIVPQSSVSGDTARFADSVSFVMTRSDAGVITIEFQASDNANLVSNAIQKPLIVDRNNSRPQIFNLVAPDTVIRPVTGRTVFQMSVAASDSDGYPDISDVFFQQLSPTISPPVPMFDSGNLTLHGDNVAGDGEFSVLVQIDSSNTLGTRQLVFLAKDRVGTYSDSLFHYLTIMP